MQPNERWVFAIFSPPFIHFSSWMYWHRWDFFYNASLSHFFCAIIKSLTGNIYRNECNMKIVKCVNIIQQINKTSLKFWSTKKQWHQTQCLGTQFNDCWWICNLRKYINFHLASLVRSFFFIFEKSRFVSMLIYSSKLCLPKKCLLYKITTKT